MLEVTRQIHARHPSAPDLAIDPIATAEHLGRRHVAVLADELVELLDRRAIERRHITLARGHEVTPPLAILPGQIELRSAERDELRTEGSQADADAAAGAPPPDLRSALAAMGERVVAMREAVTRIAGVLRRMRRVAEPLGADYLPSRGVRMLDLSAGGPRTVLPPGTPDAAPGADRERASGDRAA